MVLPVSLPEIFAWPGVCISANPAVASSIRYRNLRWQTNNSALDNDAPREPISRPVSNCRKAWRKPWQGLPTKSGHYFCRPPRQVYAYLSRLIHLRLYTNNRWPMPHLQEYKGLGLANS